MTRAATARRRLERDAQQYANSPRLVVGVRDQGARDDGRRRGRRQNPLPATARGPGMEPERSDADRAGVRASARSASEFATGNGAIIRLHQRIPRILSLTVRASGR